MVPGRGFAAGVRAAVGAIAALMLMAATDAFAQAPSAAPVGDQHSEYVFPPTGETLPYRFYVPTTWDGESALPILLFLHGAGDRKSNRLNSRHVKIPYA